MTQTSDQYESYSVAEWRTIELPGKTLAEEDRTLATRLAGGAESRLSIDEMKHGLRVTARSWVGVVRFREFELQIVPKLVGDNLRLVELIDYAAGLRALDRHPTIRTFHSAGSSLFDLIALLLVESCEQVVRGGLLSDYREVDADLPVVRGRLLLREQILRRFGKLDRLECRYDEFQTDILENRILLAALSVCASRVAHPAVAMRTRRLLAIFAEACELNGTDLKLGRSTLVYNRMNEHYREPHDLAWLILDGLGIDDIFSAGSNRCFAFLLDMNKLFEDFITRWLQQILINSPFAVIPQRRDRTVLWDAALRRPYASVIPDLLIEHTDHPGTLLPVDAKYKLYDERSIAPGDIYQTFLYAYAYGERHAILPTALLLYPGSSPDGRQVRLHVRRSSGIASARLTAVPIHIPSALEEARLTTAGGHSRQLLRSGFTTGVEPPPCPPPAYRGRVLEPLLSLVADVFPATTRV